MEIAKIEVGKLTIDPNLIKLRPINPIFVSRYRQAYRTGAVMPPILVEEGRNRVISGNHRVKAFLTEFGPKKEINVVFQKFDSKKSILETFARENATHGNALDTISRTRLALALLDAGTKIEDIAGIFNVTVKRIEKWGENVVTVIGDDGSQKVLPVKKGPDIKEKTITEEEYKTHIQADRGITVVPLSSQLTRWLTNGWVQPNAMNIKALQELGNAINNFLENV